MDFFTVPTVTFKVLFVFVVLAGRVAASRETDPADMDAEKHLFAYSVFYLFALFAVVEVIPRRLRRGRD